MLYYAGLAAGAWFATTVLEFSTASYDVVISDVLLFWAATGSPRHILFSFTRTIIAISYRGIFLAFDAALTIDE